MYLRRQTEDSFAAWQPLLEPDPTHALDPSVLQRSTCLTHLLDQLSLYATLSTVFVLDTYSQVVKHPCWQQAMSEELTSQ